MRTLRTFAIASLAVALAFGQRTKLDINTETPEGKLLQQIGQETDDAKKLALLEDFQKQFPKNANIHWVQGQMVPRYLKANQFDKIFAPVESLLAADASDAEMAHAALKAAEGKKDPDLTIKWAKTTIDAAKKAVATPKPADEDEEANWKYKVDFAKQVVKYAEYAVFAASLQATDPATKIKLMDAVKEINPQSEYAAKFDETYFMIYRQTGDSAKAIQLAETLAAKGTANEDMLLLLANGAFEKKDSAKTLDYSQKLVDYLKKAPNPEGVDPAAWEKKKNTSLGAGLWMIGMTHAQASKFADTDAALREALPYLQGNDQLLAPALFQLGLANYRLGQGGPRAKADMKRISDSIKFNQQCAAIKSPMQGQAAKNVTVIRSQFPGVK